MNTMNTIKKFLAISAIALGVATPQSSFAEKAVTENVAAPAAATLAHGEIKKIDLDTNSVTIKHGEIKSIGMPPMTMSYKLKDKALLKGVKVGDKIDFDAASENEKYFITVLKPAKR